MDNSTITGHIGSESRALEHTPTWAVAIVCTFYIVISLIIERSIYHLGIWLAKTKRKPLYETLEKMKEELMLLGMISLIITVTARYVSNVCVKSSFYDSQPTPCERRIVPTDNALPGKNLLENIFPEGLNAQPRRQLGTLFVHTCPEGQEPFVSFETLEQLHRFIFIMAVTHILYSCITMLLAKAKVQGWNVWEWEAHAETHDTLAEVTKTITMKRQSTFVRYHTSEAWSSSRMIVWMNCFFRQFGQSVTRADYLALRLGFITNHHTSHNYNFHSYMIRTMEDEFKSIVGLSTPLWLFVIAFILFNVSGTHLYFWLSFIPIILVLLVGTKLQHVIATLALENAGIQGSYAGKTLKPRDELFWFNKPELLLTLIYFIIFQSAFELATFFWSLWQFGFSSCLLRDHTLVYGLVSGVLVQFLCSYSTLPLYTLVTQMGTRYKKAIFQEEIVESLHGWRKAAKKKLKLGNDSVHDLYSHSPSVHGSDVRVKQEGEHEVELQPVPTVSEDGIHKQNDNALQRSVSMA